MNTKKVSGIGAIFIFLTHFIDLFKTADSMHPELPKWDLSSVSGSEVSLEDFNFSDFNDDEGSKCPVF